MDANWFVNIYELGYPMDSAVPLYQDNEACVTVIADPARHRSTKHMDLRHFYVTDLLAAHDQRFFIVLWTEQQPADIFTKPLGGDRLRSLVQLLGADYKN